MSKFKVGDRVAYTPVRRCTDGSFLSPELHGDSGRVTRVSDETVTVAWDKVGYAAGVYPENLVPVSTYRNVLPTDAAARNNMPLADGLLDYFPNALAAVAKLSKVANEQHNPGEPMHWARNKSTDHRNKIVKHLIDAGGIDSDGQPHSAKVAWRALALLEDELIAAGAVPGRNAIGAPEALTKPQQATHNCIEDEV